jgi:hypothetical protein
MTKKDKAENQSEIQITKEFLGTVMGHDIDELEKIALVKNKKERIGQIHQRIGEIIGEYGNGNKDYAHFDLMMKRFEILHYGLFQVEGRLKLRNIESEIEGGEIDRAWSKEQMDVILDIFEEQHRGWEEDDHGRTHYFWQAFTTSEKKEKEQNTVSDIFAKSLTERIERGNKFSSALQDELRGWFQNIQMVDADIRLDFLVAILNNPGVMHGHTRSEAINNLGLYGKAIIKQLEKNIEVSNQDAGKTLNAIRILNHLRHKGGQAGFDDSASEAKKVLMKIKDGAKNYFIQAKAEQVLTPPLEDYSISEKRAFLKGDWGNLMDPQYFYEAISEPLSARYGLSDPSEIYRMDISNPRMFSDKEVDLIFRRYRSLAGGYYRWNEYINRTSRFEEKHLRQNYNIVPLAAQGEYYQEKITREACYNRVSKNYGAIHTLDGNVDSFFRLDSETEWEAQEEEGRLGMISQGALEVFVSRFENGLKNGKLEDFLYYFHIRKELPIKLQENLDGILKLDIPDELNRKFETIFLFDEEMNKHKRRLLDSISLISRDNLEKFVSDLRELEKEKEQESQKKFSGYKSDDPYIIDFFRSFVKQDPLRISPNAHHSICYYLYFRKWLPDEFVNEFEKKFNLEVPKEFVRFNTFDDYLAVADRRLLKPFMKDFREMSTWLDEHLKELSDRIKIHKQVPERVTIAEILEREGFAKENMEEEDFKRLLLTYRSLLELPLREKMEKEFEIKLVDFSVREQVQFVNFLSVKSVKEVDRVREFLNQGVDKNNRVKAFLSLEFGQDLSQNLFTISESIEPEQADLIFAKYAEIADLAYETEKELLESVTDKDKAEIVDSRAISQDILRRGKDILIKFSAKIKSARGMDKKITTEEIMSDLQDYHRDIVFQAAAIKEGKKYGLGFRDFKGAKYRVLTAKEVAREEKMRKRMEEYYQRNWQHNPSIQGAALKNFNTKLDEGREDLIFFVFEREGELAAFSGAEKVGPERTHFFGFNVNPAMQGSKIGFDLKEASVNFFKGGGLEDDPIIKLFGTKNDIEIECDATDPRSTPIYVLKDGYVIVGTTSEFGDSLIFKAVLENVPREYYFRGKPESAVMEYYLKNNIGNKFDQGDDLIVLKFELGSEEMRKMTNKLLNQEHYRATSYFFDQTGKSVFCAFERGGSAS